MNFMTPPMFDIFNIDVWKLKMSMYLKTLGMHVYLATTKKSYHGNIKHIEVNAQALEALRRTLSKEYLSMVSHCDSAFGSVEHIDLSQAINDEICGGGIQWR